LGGVKRPVQIVVPFKLQGAKSRLAPVLTLEERRALAVAMLSDVLDALFGLGDMIVLSRPGLEHEGLGLGVRIQESELGLNDALNAFIEGHGRRGWPSDIMIAMADLALLTKETAKSFLAVEGDVVLCPGRGGGTNMILLRNPSFRTRYTGLSFPRHLAEAEDLGLRAGIFDSFRASCDIDDPGDLAELKLHAWGSASRLMEDFQIDLDAKGRASCKRSARVA